jgi:hypothetical protein
MSKRCTKEEREARMAEVESLMLKSALTRKLQHELGRRWGITARQVRNYMVAVEKAIREKEELRDAPTERSDFLARLRHAQALAIAKGDFKSVSALMHNEGRILGLNTQTKIELTGKDGGPVEVGLADLPAIRERVAAAAAELSDDDDE